MTRGNTEKMLSAAIASANLQRCFYSALFFAACTPVVLILFSFGAGQKAELPLFLPAIFFAIFSGAFAYFLYHVKKVRAKKYYEAVSCGYLVYLLSWFSYFAAKQYRQGGGLLLYYAAVLLGGYVVYTTLSRYAVLCGLELLQLLFVTAGAGGPDGAVLGMEQLLAIAGVFLFSFLLSRESYQAKRRLLTDEQKVRHELREAEHDPLTGLQNRRGLERSIQQIWGGCIQKKEAVAAILIDIDCFRQYNDKFGNVQGDTCIRWVAQSVSRTVNRAGLVARTGGGEFFVLARGLSEDDVLDLAEDIRSNVEALGIPHAAKDEVVTVSIGIGMEYVGEDTSFQGLYRKAGKKLYAAKQEGRNRVESNCSTYRRYHTVS